MKKLFSLALFFAALLLHGSIPLRIEINGQKLKADFQNVTFDSAQFERRPTPWLEKNGLSSSHILLESVRPVPEQWRDYTFSFTPSQSGKVRILLRGGWTKKHIVRWVDYDNIRVTGATIFNPSFESADRSQVIRAWEMQEVNMCVKRKNAAEGINFLRAAHDFYATQYFSVKAGKKVTITIAARYGGEMARPDRTRTLYRPMPVQNPFVTLFPKEYYRYYDAKVKLLPLKNKGISPKLITKERNPVPGDYPEAEFVVPAPSGKAAPAVKIPLELLEESGVDRIAEVRFGVPFARNTLFDLNCLQLLDASGKAVPVQLSATGFWQDKSIKWVLLQFAAPLKAHEKTVWHLVAGAAPAAPETPVAVSEVPDKLTVNTGVLEAVVDKKAFSLLSSVKVNGKYIGKFAPQGLAVRDEAGKLLAGSALVPEKFAIEERGPRRVTLKITGKYGTSAADSPGTYVVRIGFTAGSAVVEFRITHINTSLKSEFTDISSLDLSFQPAAQELLLSMEKITSKMRYFQQDDQTCTLNGKQASITLDGSGRAVTENGNITFALKDAALRYPKAFSVSGSQLNFELLPEQGSPKFNAHLPHYLLFPFCEGKYRLKWGMSFTEQLKIDFSGATAPEVLGASDVIPVVSRDYLYSTAAVPGTTPASVTAFDEWDAAALEGFYGHMELKKRTREYGFLNYGDWYGERGRNWTNNEYDLAHGLFMLYARTGNRDVFRWAQNAARHQADVDIIHAYVDPVYIGANAQHGIGHTGMNHQRIYPGTWSWPVDYSFQGKNGHTWSNGMLDAWCFTGDAAVMDSALKLGEHLTRFTSPSFKALGTHERSAGWSMKALLAYYAVTANRKYLDAATHICSFALKEQKFDKGGAWPHRMPHDHSGGHKDAFGNAPFLIGTLLGALREYHMLTGDPDVARSIVAGGNWQKLNWDEGARGFPYTASWDHKPYFLPGFSLNILIAPGILYSGLLSGDMETLAIGKKIVDMEIVTGLSPVGKNLAIRLCYAHYIIDDIMRFVTKYPQAGMYSYDPGDALKTLKKNPESFHARGPDVKEFAVILDAAETQVTFTRQKCGNRPQSDPVWKLQIFDASGKEVFVKDGDIRKNYSFDAKLSGKKGDQFRVVVADDMTGFWNILPGAGHRDFIRLKKGSSFHAASPAVLYFTVPAGTDKFTISVTGVHTGSFRAVVIRPDGSAAAVVSGMNLGAPRLPWLKYSGRPWKDATISAGSSKTAEVWKLVVLTTGDAQVAVNGIPPYMAAVPALWTGK